MPTAQSHHLQSYEYDQERQTLSVTFVNGAVYMYSGVSLDDYNRLMQSGGSGGTFWSYIRDRYPGQKIVDAPKLRNKP